MVILITLAGAAIGAVIGAAIKTTDKGEKMEKELKDSGIGELVTDLGRKMIR